MLGLTKRESKMRVNRFVLDNNIWVSYFITKNEKALIDIIERHELTIYSCDELIHELYNVLSREHLKEYEINVPEAVKIHRRATIRFKLTYPLKRYIPKDQDDDYLIALALQTNSGFIASGDSDILAEKANLERKFKKLKILTKAQFEGMFSK